MHLLNVTDKSSPGPGVGVVALVPVDAISQESQPVRKVGKERWEARRRDRAYKDFRPAMRGWVAQEPPSTMLCFSSKKSAGISVTLAAVRDGARSQW